MSTRLCACAKVGASSPSWGSCIEREKRKCKAPRNHDAPRCTFKDYQIARPHRPRHCAIDSAKAFLEKHSCCILSVRFDSKRVEIVMTCASCVRAGKCGRETCLLWCQPRMGVLHCIRQPGLLPWTQEQAGVTLTLLTITAAFLSRRHALL
jgi:hypothetical protein